MLRRIGRFQQIRPGEGAITALMVSYIAGVTAFYYILKPMRSALFLKDLPASDLPNAYLLTALVAGPLVALIFRLSRRISMIALLTATNLGVVASLLLLRWAVGAQFRYLPYVYFTYVQIVSVLCVAQFWMLAGYVFDGRQAKRIYGLLGTGAIAGSIVGGLITDFLKRESMATMLGVCVGILVALIALAQWIWRRRKPEFFGANEFFEGARPSGQTMDTLRTVFGSRLLKLLVLLMFLTMIASQIADWQVDYAAQEHFKDLPKQLMEQEIKSFRARFYWVANLVGIGIQVTLTRIVLQRIGIWAAVLFLPVGLGISSFGVLLFPSLSLATVALGCDSVFRYSINRTGLELLFLPLSPGMRKRVKLFVDVFADRAGRAVAAFLIIALTTRLLPAGLTGTAAVLVALTCASFLVGLKLNRGYVDTFRQQLARREVDLSDISRYVTDPASLRLLTSSLESPNDRQILYSLGLLQSARGSDFSKQLLPLLEHRSAAVREEAVRTLHALPQSREAEAERLLHDPSNGVRIAAIEYLCRYDPTRTGERLRQLLDHPQDDIRLAAGRFAIGQTDITRRPSMDLIRSLMALDRVRSIEVNEAAARLAARLPERESAPLLRRLLLEQPRQSAPAGSDAGVQAGRQKLVFEILPLLSDKNLRPASRQALVSIGPKITADLAEVLGDASRDSAVRCEIPWILGRLQNRRAAQVLVENLNAEDPRVRYQIVKALSRMHARDPQLPERLPLVEVHVVIQIMAYYEGLALCQALETEGPSEGNALLGKALRESLERQLEMVFRLLGLSYPQKDIFFAYTALKGSHKGKRVSAIEFLENILKKDVKSLVIPLLEEELPGNLIARAVRTFNLQIPDRDAALDALLRHPDPWLRACSLHAVGSDRIMEFEPTCHRLMQDPDPRVREMAAWSLNRMLPENAREVSYVNKP
jgi:HEAT repeat protein